MDKRSSPLLKEGNEKQYHILNGDSLKEQFPENIQGEIIIARECLVDGSVKGRTLVEFAPVFRAFNKRGNIYGFGDLQVKRLFDEIKNLHL
ncbi:MAG: hypothetical protein DHS20C18_44460 [Saprospiraceae bacterium]|nr:MAG: hypothetical protein DHS20C18_44460 [Saprospiraceae bacterium]